MGSGYDPASEAVSGLSSWRERGGNDLIKMSLLAEALEAAGLNDVRTYIQSGNVLVSSSRNNTRMLARLAKDSIRRDFDLAVDVAVFSAEHWGRVIKASPKWWGADQAWKHNMLILIPPCDAHMALKAIGELKPAIEHLAAGDGVLYQSLSFEKFSRTTGGKLASKPIYKKMTVRNYNTATKMLALASMQRAGFR